MADIAFQLRRERESRGLSLRTLGRMAGVSSSSLNRWESGIGCPPEDILEKLSSIFRAPISPRAPDRVRLSAVHRGALLRSMRLRHGLSQTDAAVRFGFSRASISRWESGDREACEQVVGLYLEAFHPTNAEAEALGSGEVTNPFAGGEEIQLGAFISRLRDRRLVGTDESLDLCYLAADAALPKQGQIERMQLYDAYIESLAWEYRHREATIWARRTLDIARRVRNYDFVGRAVRATAHQLFTEAGRPDDGLAFLASAMRLTHGSASEAMVARESVDRLAQAGRVSEAWSLLDRAMNVPGSEMGDVDRVGCQILGASLAICEKRFKVALEVLAQVHHPDPYMTNHLTQLEAESRHALGDTAQCRRVLEDGIREMARPGMRHFCVGLIDRLSMVSVNAFDPDLWSWQRSGMLRGGAYRHN